MENNHQELKKFIKQIRGISYKPHQVSEEPKEGFVPLLRATNILEGILNLDNVIYVEKDLVKEEQLLREGDILIAASSGSLKAVGKSASFKGKGKYTFGAFCKVVRPVDIQADYLFHYFNTPTFRITIQNLINGANIKNIKNEHIDNLSFFIPEASEQSQIVNLLNTSKNLINKRKSQIAALEELTQSLFLELFGDPISNSKNWPQVTLNELGEWKSGGTPPKSNKDYYMVNIPWLSSGELNEIYTYESEEHITEKAVEESATKYIEEGSILLGMYDTAALKSTIVKMRCTCNQAIAFSKLDENRVSTLYVYQYIQMAKEHLKRQQRGVRQKNMNLSMIKDLILMYPPLELQKQFEKCLKMILEKKQLLKCGLAEIESLYHALLQKCFKGELSQ